MHHCYSTHENITVNVAMREGTKETVEHEHPKVTYDTLFLHEGAPGDIPAVANPIYEEVPTNTNSIIT